MMKRTGMAILLTAGLVMSSALQATAQQENSTTLDAFNRLLSENAALSNADGKEFYSLLDKVMAGDYGPVGKDRVLAEQMAGDLEALSRISNRDLASYASDCELKMAQVRNAYYKALAAAVEAGMLIDPEKEERYGSVQQMLSLFLETDDSDATDEIRTRKDEIRSELTPDYAGELAKGCDLPVSFLEFIIMDRNWSDESWKNDEAWMKEAKWTQEPDAAEGKVTVGDADAEDTGQIAALQNELIRLGYYKGKADGVFGPLTLASLIEFQLANGMTPDGIYDGSVHRRLTDPEAVSRRDYGEAFWDEVEDLWDDDDDDDDRDDNDDDDDRDDNDDDDDRYDKDDDDD